MALVKGIFLISVAAVIAFLVSDSGKMDTMVFLSCTSAFALMEACNASEKYNELISVLEDDNGRN